MKDLAGSAAGTHGLFFCSCHRGPDNAAYLSALEDTKGRFFAIGDGSADQTGSCTRRIADICKERYFLTFLRMKYQSSKIISRSENIIRQIVLRQKTFLDVACRGYGS